MSNFIDTSFSTLTGASSSMAGSMYGDTSVCATTTCGGVRPAMAMCAPSMSVPVIPVYSSPGYDTLTNNLACSGGNGGYFTLTDGYGNSCTQLRAQLDAQGNGPCAAPCGGIYSMADASVTQTCQPSNRCSTAACNLMGN